MANDIWYSVKKNRIKKGCIKGFSLGEEGKLIFEKKDMEHSIFLQPFDGVKESATWGRLSCSLFLSEQIVCYIYVIALDNIEYSVDDGKHENITSFLCDPEENTIRKLHILKALGAKRVVNTGDTLLYELSGRYLFIAIEMLGTGKASIGNIRVGVRGDVFMNAFPAVYQERNSFFHRYLSIFSSIYNDCSEQNEKLYEMLDLDRCSPELLELYGSWFGIDLKGGFLPEDTLRQLVKEAYQLNRMKGTKWAIERIVEIVVGQDCVLLENRLQDGGIFDVTILINKKLSEDLRHQLMFLLDQFRPLRTKIRLLQMEKEAVMDGNSYLDMNAAIPKEKHVVLDEEAIYDGAITLM
ncbi:MAG: hypothetical protein II842_17965 [Butyrivibrio sp.]|nr:hypothetical protein [Butyrivibrio sp.]